MDMVFHKKQIKCGKGVSMTNETPSSSQNPQDLFRERIKRVDDAIALQEGDRVPFAPFNSALPYFLYGGTFRDSMYDYEKASQCILRFYQDFQPDADIHLAFTSGRSNELAGSTMIDWPGRPGTRVPDFSTHLRMNIRSLSMILWDLPCANTSRARFPI